MSTSSNLDTEFGSSPWRKSMNQMWIYSSRCILYVRKNKTFLHCLYLRPLKNTLDRNSKGNPTNLESSTILKESFIKLLLIKLHIQLPHYQCTLNFNLTFIIYRFSQYSVAMLITTEIVLNNFCLHITWKLERKIQLRFELKSHDYRI